MKKYQIIYADPPWSMRVWNQKKTLEKGYDKSKAVGVPLYPTMKTEDIKKLKINEIADKDCVLFCWITFPLLPEGLEVIKSWGFNYKTVGFTWVKKNKSDCGFFFGLGRWTRCNAEFCLLATKGKPHRINNSISQLIFAPLTRHSQKPFEVREKIVELLGDLPRIELFAREKAEGWDVFGNEVKSDIEL